MTEQGKPRVVQGEPSTVALMLKAALPVLPGVSMLPGVRKSGSTLPDLVLTRHDVPIDRGHVARYAEVCGFGRKETVPITYPHMLAFPLHMQIMTDREFPYAAIGTVHLENRITQHRAISAGERLQVTARAANQRPHSKGTVFDIVTEVHSAGEPVWEETSTFLRRGKPAEGAGETGSTLTDVPTSGIVWRLPGDLGRRYASVSGDRNPIHLYRPTAKAFGFPRQIAHGMWSKARCLAALEGRVPDGVHVEVAFKKPILLPGQVAFGAVPEETAGGHGTIWRFSLTNPKDGSPHLLGSASAL